MILRIPIPHPSLRGRNNLLKVLTHKTSITPLAISSIIYLKRSVNNFHTTLPFPSETETHFVLYKILRSVDTKKHLIEIQLRN